LKSTFGLSSHSLLTGWEEQTGCRGSGEGCREENKSLPAKKIGTTGLASIKEWARGMREHTSNTHIARLALRAGNLGRNELNFALFLLGYFPKAIAPSVT